MLQLEGDQHMGLDDDGHVQRDVECWCEIRSRGGPLVRAPDVALDVDSIVMLGDGEVAAESWSASATG